MGIYNYFIFVVIWFVIGETGAKWNTGEVKQSSFDMKNSFKKYNLLRGEMEHFVASVGEAQGGAKKVSIQTKL